MPAYRLRADLIARVAGILGVSEVGQDLAPEDSELIDGQIDATCASLAARGVIYLMSTLPTWTIPLAIFEELAAIVAANVPDYGQALDGSAAEDRLRLMQARGPSYEPLRVEYF